MRWTKRTPAAPPRIPSPASAMTCWRPASPPSTRTPPRPWPSTGPTWKPSPAAARHHPVRRPRSLLGTPQQQPARPQRGDVSGALCCLNAATMMAAGHGTPMPELARRMTLATCHLDPVRALIKVLTRMPGNGMPLVDILADSGYAHRDAAAWAIPLRQAGAQLIQDLHPSDPGPRGTHHGAIIANGNLYCPQTPTPLL